MATVSARRTGGGRHRPSEGAGSRTKRAPRPRIETTTADSVYGLFPRQWVAIEVTEVTPNVGMTKGLVIAHGSEKKVLAKLDEFIAANPGRKWGLLNTRPWLKPGEDAIIEVY